ncbi:MAG: ABC transporter permease [Flavobacteriaceae bacterium]|nr:ABC transporter permease [Flavobacteriaceae bacterium]
MKTITKIIIREIQRLKSRPSAWVLVLVIPTLIFFYLGSIYKQGAIEHVNIAVKNDDHTKLSETIIQNIEASPKLNIVKFLNSSDDLESVFVDHPEIKGIYLIPRDFEKNIYRGEQSKLIVYTNSSNIVYGNLLYKEAATFINTVSAGINLKMFQAKGIPYKKAIKMVMPIKVITKPLFNPYYNYLFYLIPGIATALLQMIVFFMAARSINSEHTNKTYNELYQLSGQSIFNIIFGKLITYTLIGFLVGLVIFSVIYPLFGIPLSENTLLFMIIIFIFSLVNAMLGLMISAIFKNEAIAMDMSFVYNSPAFVFSGFTFPMMAMPAFESWYAQLIPYTHFLKAFIKGFEMNTPFHYLYPQVINLLLFFLFGYIVTVIALLISHKKMKI